MSGKQLPITIPEDDTDGASQGTPAIGLSEPAVVAQEAAGEDPGSLSPEAEIVMQRLHALREEEDVDEYGVLAPTAFSFETACTLVREVADRLQSGFPRGWVTPDSEGGIRIEWSRGARQVRLVVPAREGGQRYLYWEEESQASLDQNVSSQSLAEKLSWLIGDAEAG
jgi:hypothetical protein